MCANMKAKHASIFRENGSLTDYLLVWIENQNRTPNDRYALNTIFDQSEQRE